MEPGQYFRIFKTWFWLILLAIVLSGGTSFLVSRELPKTYQGSTTLIVGTVTRTTNPEYSSVLASQLLAKTYSKLLTSRPVLDGAIKDLQLESVLTPSQLEKSVSVETIRDTQLIVLRVRSESPELAARLANFIADELLTQSPASTQGQLGSVMNFVDKQMVELEGEISSLQQSIKALKERPVTNPPAANDEIVAQEGKLRSAQERYGTLLSARTGMTSNYVSIVERAEVPEIPVSPNIPINVGLACFLGLVLAIGGILLLEYLDDTAKSPDTVSEITGVPTLGMVSQLQNKEYRENLITLRSPKSPATEAFRSLRTSILFTSPDNPVRSLLVTSSEPGDGKTTILGNLATSMAQAGLKVIAVDADLRRPALHKLFGLSNNFGLTSLLASQNTAISEIIQSTDEPNLSIVASGPLPPNPSELLGSQRLQNILIRLKEEADLLLIDSPPALMITDPIILSTRVDGVIMVADSGRTRMGSLKRAVGSVQNVGGRVLGVVLNKIKAKDGRYYYYNYQNYYSSDGKQEPSKNGHSTDVLLSGAKKN